MIDTTVNLTSFSRTGFFCQMPSLTDKTFFLTKHTDRDTEQVWIKLKKRPEVEYIKNYKTKPLTAEVEQAVGELLGSLGYVDYIVLGEK